MQLCSGGGRYTPNYPTASPLLAPPRSVYTPISHPVDVWYLCPSSACTRVVFTLISWLSNEPTNVGSLLFATNYWTSVFMHAWMTSFLHTTIPVLSVQLPDQWCARLRNWYCWNINTPSQSCRHFFVRNLSVWHFFVYLPYYLRIIFHFHIKRPVVTMVGRCERFCEIFCHIFQSRCPFYLVSVQSYLID